MSWWTWPSPDTWWENDRFRRHKNWVNGAQRKIAKQLKRQQKHLQFLDRNLQDQLGPKFHQVLKSEIEAHTKGFSEVLGNMLQQNDVLRAMRSLDTDPASLGFPSEEKLDEKGALRVMRNLDDDPDSCCNPLKEVLESETLKAQGEHA